MQINILTSKGLKAMHPRGAASNYQKLFLCMRKPLNCVAPCGCDLPKQRVVNSIRANTVETAI